MACQTHAIFNHLYLSLISFPTASKRRVAVLSFLSPSSQQNGLVSGTGGAAKAAVDHLTRVMALELGPRPEQDRQPQGGNPPVHFCLRRPPPPPCSPRLGLPVPHGIRVNAVNPTVVLTEMGQMAWSDPTKARPEPLLPRPCGRIDCLPPFSVIGQDF